MSEENAQEKFEGELFWCISKLEESLQSQKCTEKQGRDIMKVLKILRSTKAPLIKKRQAMRSMLGDYRGQMHTEERRARQVISNSKKLTVANDGQQNMSTFFRRSCKLGHVSAANDESPSSDGPRTDSLENKTFEDHLTEDVFSRLNLGEASNDACKSEQDTEGQQPFRIENASNAKTVSQDTLMEKQKHFTMKDGNNSFRFHFSSE